MAKRIVVKLENRQIGVNVENIQWYEPDGDATVLHMKNGDTMRIDEPYDSVDDKFSRS